MANEPHDYGYGYSPELRNFDGSEVFASTEGFDDSQHEALVCYEEGHSERSRLVFEDR
jgi:hypothetical protein